MSNSILIMDGEAITRALRRIAHEILEHNPDPDRFSLVGIQSRGVELARRLAELIVAIEGKKPQLGAIDISMHRDDLSIRNTLTSVRETRLPLHLEQLTVVLVDDVLYTGRTCRAAMDAISSFGRPARIQLAVLLDRGHRELPIRPDYIGKNLPTSQEERVKVRLQNVDLEPDSVRVERP
ncbi:MAG: bifunctional pyr operon transcriptional regulator/uracil phosphoribosyltransferase PyrR [Verrucomicrobia bacterium]|jgi:pyrimidine operon attenuation protein / uracil phosphoribosyltransferase|nr:bifunctional pyr operon transcriptional regulator/uracil phosphoribosyltransferase PyrR [Verrucomicrobiota bacterium]MBV8532690.1 bifunctional pyr operon transcriptional regulator/uracil phosphoribosyltransferase PyrR [Verrucomicrobiota bacterium]